MQFLLMAVQGLSDLAELDVPCLIAAPRSVQEAQLYPVMVTACSGGLRSPLILEEEQTGCSNNQETLLLKKLHRHTKLAHLLMAVISMLHNHLLIPVHLQSFTAKQDLVLAFYFR